MRRSATCSALVLAGALALPAHATTTGPVSFSDPTGDANGLNGQGLTAVPGQSTGAADVASADLVGVKLATLRKRKAGKLVPYGITVTMTLAAAPDNHTDYLFSATAPAGCGTGTTLDLQYNGYVAVPVTVVSCSDGTTSTDLALGPAVLDAAKHTITWSIDGSGLPAKSKLEDLGAASTVLVLGRLDEASSDAVYTYA